MDSCSRLDKRRVTLCPVAVHLVMRDAMLSHMQPALCRASILVQQASCSAVDRGVQCSQLFLHSRCNACKLSRQSVGLIELCATMRANNSTVARVVLCCRRVQPEKENDVNARDKVLQIVQFLCTAFAMHVAHISNWRALHIQLSVCVAHVPILKHVILTSHKWYKMTQPGHIKLGKRPTGPCAYQKLPPYYYFNNFIVIILFLCIRQLPLTNMIFLL